MGKGMSDNGFFGENQIGNTNNESRRKLTSRILGGIASELSDKKAAEAAAERRKHQGNGKFTKAGSDDRVNGADYIYPENAVTEDDKRSYHYGYIVHGGRRLYAVIDALQKENKIEEIVAIGYRDFENRIDEEHLGMLSKNEYYMEGYNAAKVKRSR